MAPKQRGVPDQFLFLCIRMKLPMADPAEYMMAAIKRKDLL